MSDENLTYPEVGSEWISKDYQGENPLVYTVICITNTARLTDNHPPQVIYNSINGNIWSLPLSAWPGSLKPKESDTSNWIL